MLPGWKTSSLVTPAAPLPPWPAISACRRRSDSSRPSAIIDVKSVTSPPTMPEKPARKPPMKTHREDAVADDEVPGLHSEHLEAVDLVAGKASEAHGGLLRTRRG